MYEDSFSAKMLLHIPVIFMYTGKYLLNLKEKKVKRKERIRRHRLNLLKENVVLPRRKQCDQSYKVLAQGSQIDHRMN